MHDFIKYGVAHRISEAQFEKTARTGHPRGKPGGGESVARLSADDFNGSGYIRFATPVTACGLAADDKERANGGGGPLQ